MMSKAKKEIPAELIIKEVVQGVANVWVRGLTPFICHAMSAKARQEFLFPRGRKTKADKQQTMKHNPLEEYRCSAYRSRGPGEPTRILMPATAFKSAICNAALETPGIEKTQIGRLVWVEGAYVSLYGAPQMHMAVVRNSDMKHTPDVRTRAILPEWACSMTLRFAAPQLNAEQVVTLLGRAGVFIGVGDFRQEKGKGNYGQFEVCSERDCAEIVKAGGLEAQDAAFAHPTFFDSETEELYSWFEAERKERGEKRGQKREAAG